MQPKFSADASALTFLQNQWTLRLLCVVSLFFARQSALSINIDTQKSSLLHFGHFCCFLYIFAVVGIAQSPRPQARVPASPRCDGNDDSGWLIFYVDSALKKSFALLSFRVNFPCNSHNALIADLSRYGGIDANGLCLGSLAFNSVPHALSATACTELGRE